MEYKIYIIETILKMIIGLIILGVLVMYFVREAKINNKIYENKKFSQKDVKKRIEKMNSKREI